MPTASTFSIRPLTDAPADDVAWARLRQALWPDCPVERHAVEKEIYLRSPGVVLFAVDATDTAIGFAEVSRRRDHVVASSTATTPYLEGWYVEPGWRGRGVGRALIDAAADWARQAGYRELASDAELDNVASQTAHQRLGFREVERTVSFLKPL